VSFLAPGYLVAAAVVAATIVAIHFLSTRQPRTVPLPTARFAPDRVVRAQTRAIRLQDVLLMLVRAALVLAVGAALARPVVEPPRRALARILLVDRSRAVARNAEVADTVRAYFAPGDAVVFFDSSARVLRDPGLDSIPAAAPTSAQGNLSAALVASLRAASAMRDAVDSVELVVISPLVSEEFDEATDSIRALWPGSIRLARLTARGGTNGGGSTTLDALPDDPFRYALARAGANSAQARVVRGAVGAADSAWARETGHVLVAWAARGAQPAGAFWSRRSPADTVGAVLAGDAVVVAPFPRTWKLTVGNSTRRMRVSARWVDGDAAAVEEPLGSGCMRTVAIEVPARGDLVLEPRFARLVAALAGPCGGHVGAVMAGAVRTTTLAGRAPRTVVGRAIIVPASSVPTPLARWLLLAGAVLALAEMIVRQSRRGAITEAA
jgi:Aerotolerance regulator N-terminal